MRGYLEHMRENLEKFVEKVHGAGERRWF